MSFRIGLYDFFAYMIPGVFYILVAAFGLNIFGFVDINQTSLNNFSLFTFFILLGAGYVLGLLIDTIAYKWLHLFKGKSQVARERTFVAFQVQFPELELQFNPKDWSIILQAIKIQTPDLLADIEKHNALSIMLRNLSLGLFITSLLFIHVFILLNSHLGNLFIAIAALGLSYFALSISSRRRHWFYKIILEIFVTNYLLQEKMLTVRLQASNDEQQKSLRKSKVENVALQQGMKKTDSTNGRYW